LLKLDQGFTSLGIDRHLDEKVAIVVIAIEERCVLTDEHEDFVLSRIKVLVTHRRRLDTCVHQEQAKDDMSPDRTVHNHLFYTEENHSEYDGSTDTIEQRLVLEIVRRTENFEDDVEEEQAIDG